MAVRTYRDKDGVLRVVDGSPFYIRDLKEHYDICCDCGLTHKVKYRVEDINGDPVKNAKIKVWVWVDKDMTKEERSKVEIRFAKKRGGSYGR